MLNQVIKNYDAKSIHRNTANQPALSDDFTVSTSASQRSAATTAASTVDTTQNPSVPEDGLKLEVEQLGAELGKRTSDHLAMKSEEQMIYQIDKTRFLCCQVWTYLFNHRVTTLKSNGQGAY